MFLDPTQTVGRLSSHAAARSRGPCVFPYLNVKTHHAESACVVLLSLHHAERDMLLA